MTDRIDQEILRIVEEMRATRHPVQMPDARSFSDLFLAAGLYEERARPDLPPAHVWAADVLLPRGGVSLGGGRAELSSFVSVKTADPRKDRTVPRHYALIASSPTPALLSCIWHSMMLLDGYIISLEVVDRLDGTSMVWAHHNMISGTRLVAVVRTESVPHVFVEHVATASGATVTMREDFGRRCGTCVVTSPDLGRLEGEWSVGASDEVSVLRISVDGLDPLSSDLLCEAAVSQCGIADTYQYS